MTREDFAIAVPLFLRATELDAELALPHAGLASLRIYEAFFHWTDSPSDALVESLASARTALALDPLDSTTYAVLGASLAFSGKHDHTLAVCRKAIELNPSNAAAFTSLGVAHYFRGEPESGIGAIEAAIRLSPNDVLLHTWVSGLAGLHILARDYAKAAECARLAVQGAPQFPPGWRSLANALGQLGRLDEAREALAKFLALSPGLCSEQAIRASTGFRDEAVFQHYLEGLRKAGWKG
jgi:adenylate cyclase